MRFLWGFFVVPMLFPCYILIFLLDSCGIPVGFLWDFHDISIIFPIDSYEISMRFLWDLNRISMVLL